MKPSESQFRGAVIEMAEWLGWRSYAIRRSDKVLLSETSRGFPDVTLARDKQLLIVELKKDRDTRDEHQHAWADALPADVYRLWTPRDLPAIERLLRK